MSRIIKRVFVRVLTFALVLSALQCLHACSADTEPTDGSGTFTLSVVFSDGREENQSYTFDRAGELGDFLTERDVIDGEQGPYGLYVTTVMGEYHKYEEDGLYWALYVNGELSLVGISDIELSDGAEYALKAQ